jgi:hypothetical protein
MTQDEQNGQVPNKDPGRGGPPLEERGIVHDVIVPIVSNGVNGAIAGAAGAGAAHLLKSSKKDDK